MLCEALGLSSVVNMSLNMYVLKCLSAFPFCYLTGIHVVVAVGVIYPAEGEEQVKSFKKCRLQDLNSDFVGKVCLVERITI